MLDTDIEIPSRNVAETLSQLPPGPYLVRKGGDLNLVRTEAHSPARIVDWVSLGSVEMTGSSAARYDQPFLIRSIGEAFARSQSSQGESQGSSSSGFRSQAARA